MLTLRTGSETDLRLTRPTAADLVRTTELAPGLAVGIDLADPSHWHAIDVRRWAAADPALLGAVLGPPAVRQLSAGAARGVPVEVASAPAWRRLAVIDALDWWLQLPLNQGLLDAERAIARARAAASLPAGLLRRALVDRAIVSARRSADELTVYLNGLTGASLPRALFSGLSRLAGGYAALRQEVDGPDDAFAAVQSAWERVRSASVVGTIRDAAAASLGAVPGPVLGAVPGALPGVGAVAATAGPAVGRVDPRQLRARVVGSDVRMLPAADGTAVRVVVPSYAPRPSALVADRVMVRLVDRRSGEAQEPVLLTLRSGVFSEVVPLGSTPVEYLRADLFDADSEVAPAEDIGRACRAQLVLSEWRRAVAESRVSRSVRTRNGRLTRLLDALTPAKGPLFRGGPARADIVDAMNGTARHPWFRSTTAAGAPLVAELAAVHADR